MLAHSATRPVRSSDLRDSGSAGRHSPAGIEPVPFPGSGQPATVYTANSEIFAQGEKAGAIYQVAFGAVRIYRQYGENAIEQVRSNPYRLSSDIWGIGFQTADALALQLGIPRDSPFRAQAAVRHVLREAQGDGHVGFPEELVLEAAQQLT